MRFRTRAFLLCFVPFAALFAASFWVAQSLVQSTVRRELLASLGQSQLALAHVQAKADLQSSRFLKVEGENPALFSAMQSLLSADVPSDNAGKVTSSQRANAGKSPLSLKDNARNAMEDQLRALGEQMDLDLLFVSTTDGGPVAGVKRGPSPKPGQKGQLVPLEGMLVAQPSRGLLVLGDRIFQFASAPIGDADASFGTLSVGEHFDLPQPAKPAVLVHDDEVIDSNLSNVFNPQVDEAMRDCGGRQECDFRLGNAHWIAFPMQDLGGGYTLWSLDNMDEAASPIRTRLQSFFLFMGIGSLLVALLCGIASARSIEKPIALMIQQLRNAEKTGVLPEAPLALSSATEIRELAESYTRAAVSARNARWKLESAYVGFIGSLANALDARDRYTFGHSERVSYYSSATALAMGLELDHVDRIRIGAQLHDVGKIGVPDRVLQKPGRLTAEEFAMVKEHPVIGRRILDGVEGLAAYLEIVELHHENWDGTGYPRRQSGEETPIDARIVHVADAYDAMTSNRSYRSRMTHEEAIQELIRCAGTQFDARIVEAFLKLPREVFAGMETVLDDRARVLEAARAD